MNVSRPFYVLTLILTAGLLLAAAPAHAKTPLVDVLKANPKWVGTVDMEYSLAVSFHFSGDPAKVENVSYRWEQEKKRIGGKLKLDDENIEFMIPPLRRERWYKLTLTKEGTLQGWLTGLYKDGHTTFQMPVFLRPASAAEARAAWTVVQPIQSKKVRYVAITTGFPIISTSVNGAKQDVVIYISPSCPTCIRLYSALVLEDLLNSVSLERANISFVVVPRFDSDHEVIKNLFCVKHQQVFTSVSKFFGSALKIAYFQRGSDRTESLNSLSADIARSFGVPDSALAMCQANNKFDSTIRAAWDQGWRQNPEQKWPLVVINDDSTNIKNTVALVEALRE